METKNGPLLKTCDACGLQIVVSDTVTLPTEKLEELRTKAERYDEMEAQLKSRDNDRRHRPSRLSFAVREPEIARVLLEEDAKGRTQPEIHAMGVERFGADRMPSRSALNRLIKAQARGEPSVP